MKVKIENFGDPGRKPLPSQNQCLGLANREKSAVENKGEFPRLANPETVRHHAVAKILRIALTLGAHRFTEDGRMAAWVDFAKVMTLRLTERERALLAYWALRTLAPEIRLAVMQGAHEGAL